jgi:hypothetical protein
MSATRKARQRERLRRVDKVVATLDSALARLQPRLAPAAFANRKIRREFQDQLSTQQEEQARTREQMSDGADGEAAGMMEDEGAAQGRMRRQMGQMTKLIERWKAEMPTEGEMLAKDKYTIFDRKERKYRKGIHSEWAAWKG